MQPRWRALLMVACVLLAGCGGSGTTGVTPENPQTTADPYASKTVPDPVYRLEVLGRSDSPVEVTVGLTSVDNETVYYENEFALPPDGLRDYSSHVENVSRFRATVSVANDSVTRVVGPDEGYAVWVQNRSSVTAYESGSA